MSIRPASERKGCFRGPFDDDRRRRPRLLFPSAKTTNFDLLTIGGGGGGGGRGDIECTQPPPNATINTSNDLQDGRTERIAVLPVFFFFFLLGHRVCLVATGRLLSSHHRNARLRSLSFSPLSGKVTF